MEISKIISSKDLIEVTGVKSQEKILNEQNAQTVFREALVTPTIKHLYSLIEGVTSASSKTIWTPKLDTDKPYLSSMTVFLWQPLKMNL